MITNERILELARTCGLEEFIGERDGETDGMCYQFWEEQFFRFANEIYNVGHEDGWESRADAEYLNSSYPTGLVGEPQ